ncbi:cytochrome P450 [Cystobacter ferrugineus]|uniref:Cytochrome P450 n=1 Tax=Cystobacter ferrugineus TaxID=83449 RepID=A0A1L9BCG8_9BACT|nr:cytochrome P450 [Cystobacter ferrugineus]OJH39936.1 cytochrome P450 [Cystobacter ferrugineus]
MPNVLSRGIFNLFFGARRKGLESLPGPQPGIIGTAGDFLGSMPWNVCARYGREYGGVTLIWLGGTPALVLNDPELIAQVLDSRQTEFEKGSLRQELTPTTTEHSIFIAEHRGDWALKRQQDPFVQGWSPDWLAAQVAPMQAAVARAVDALIAKGEKVDLAPVLRRLTFDVFAVAGMGETPPDSVYEDFMLLAKGADARIQAKIPLRFVSLPKGFEQAQERFYRFFEERLTALRKSPKPGAVDLMSWMLREMPGFDDAWLARHVALMFYGGVFSSSTSLVGAFHQLQKHPEAEARLAAEAADFAGGPPTLERLNAARWVEAVTLEALRLLPAVRVFTRSPAAEMKLAGATLPAGTTIMISNQHLHRDPKHWTHPDSFEPTRWLDGGTARDPIGSGHFFPFGRGPRMCVATDFAMVFLRTAVATIAARARVQVQSTEPFEEGFFFGVVLPKDVQTRFVAR